ncbi:MAG: MotA/TolQ/ExbB proton channel family protein [Siphonobacter sp.]
MSDSTAALANQDASGRSLSVIELLAAGGWIMIPIAILLFATIFIFVERWLYLKKATSQSSAFEASFWGLIQSGNLNAAKQMCRNDQSAVSRVLEKGLSRIGTPIPEIEQAMSNSAQLEIAYMEKNLSLLGTFAAIAPMFGFLGTVAGMIRAFHDISVSNNLSIGTISGGIYEKMITSASGLAIGILAYVLLTILNGMVDRAVTKLQIATNQFLDVLYQPINA